MTVSERTFLDGNMTFSPPSFFFIFHTSHIGIIETIIEKYIPRLKKVKTSIIQPSVTELEQSKHGTF